MKKCPVCLAVFSSFCRVGRRPQAKCPSCGAYERHRISWLYLADCTKFFDEHMSMLHFAPEPVFRRRMSAMGNIDYTPALYDPKSPALGVDIQRLPYRDASFDVIYCSHVLEHVEDDASALGELFRVIRPRGIVLIMVPQSESQHTYEDPTKRSPDERREAFGQSDHVRIYGQDFTDRLRRAGFSVEKITHAERYSKAECETYGLTFEPLYICSRP